jgi:hypothetical protein
MMMVLRPVMVDPWRSGGTLGRRSFFAAAGPLAARPLGPMLGLSASVQARVSQAVDRAIDALGVEIEAVGVEADLVSPPTLRVQPEDYTQISIVGTVLGPQEIRSVVLADARSIDGLAARIQTGALSHYLTPEQATALADIRSRAQRLVEYEQGQDIQAVLSEHVGIANQHVDRHLAAPRAAVADAEKTVVTGEAGTVPVLEPAEKTLSKTELVAGVGVVAGIGILLWTLLS